MVEAGAGFAGSLGYVLGDVRGYGVLVRAVAVGVQRPGVDLLAPAQDQVTYGRTVRCVEADAPGGCAYSIDEEVSGGPDRGFVVRSRRSIEANNGMDVDGRPPLVLGDAGEGEPSVLGEA